MWLRDPIDIEVSRSADIPIGMQFWDEYADAPLDVTGYQFSLLLAKNEGQTPFSSVLIEETDPSNGNIDFVVKSAFFQNTPGSMETVVLAYQVVAQDIDGNSVIAARGALIVRPGIISKIISDDGSDAVWSREDW